jgi:hypothetical protein
MKSDSQKADRIVLQAYGHLLKCLFTLFSQFVISKQTDVAGAFFLGMLLCRLIYRFDLHFSLNTFYLTKISPYYLKVFSDWFRLTEETCVGLGAYGNSQGGEHKNKFTKAAGKIWTNGHPGHFKELLDQMAEMFIAAPSIFPQLIPKLNASDINPRAVWEKHFCQKIGGSCSCCGHFEGNDNLKSFSTFCNKFDDEECFQFGAIKTQMANSYFEEFSVEFMF